MTDRSVFNPLATGAIALFFLAGCTTPARPPAPAPAATDKLSTLAADTAPGGLVRITTKRGEGLLYARPDHHIGGYDAIRLGPVLVTYTKNSTSIPEDEIRRLAKRLRDGIAQGVGESGLELAKAPGPCVLDVQLQLLDLELHENENAGLSHTSFVSSLGAVTLIFEMSDSQTAAPLIRFGERRQLGGAHVAGTMRGAQIDRLGRALGTMFEHMGRQMQDVTPLSDTPRLQGVCEGLVGKSANPIVPTG